MTYSVTPSASGTSIKQDGVEVASINASGEWRFKVGASLLNTSSIGIGQTWQDVTASRALNTTYTNSSGRPIYVHITTVNTGASNGARLTVGGVLIRGDDPTSSSPGFPMVVQAVVPNGQTYVASNTAQTLTSWLELS
jgi:hypothetical protein